ncbi:hypothetical protein [Clostridium sp. 1001275B_160808_H3]|uniref:hypothetical protein n=1 Tax=Clostridium sp. 1001275B_160808_H3 TaxID=2787110 RepID=UPI00189BEC47|nr:hypothetical protein [Clostridium sp. 1001275B_160808_H3]
MNEKKCDCFLVRNKMNSLLRFSYSNSLGIYYQTFRNGKWQEKDIIYKESFETFYVIEDFNGNVNVLCQDVCGDVVLCTLDDSRWKYKTLLHMKYNEIMPIELKAFFIGKKIHFLYNLINENDETQMIIHQHNKRLNDLAPSEVLITLDCYSNLSYYISQSYNYCVVLINTMSYGIYKLSSRVFNISKDLWEKEMIIYISRLPYKDFSFCVLENRCHYLIVTEENNLNVLIYQYKDILSDKQKELQKNLILFENEKVDSCTILTLDKVLWALWISDKKLYGCFSKNNGQDFSNPAVYKIFEDIMPTKAYYKEFIEENRYIDNEIYIINYNNEVNLFLHELLIAKVDLDIDSNKQDVGFEDILYGNIEISYKDIDNKSRDLISLDKEVKDNYEHIEVSSTEKLQNEIKCQNEKIIKLDNKIKMLNNTIGKQKNELASLRYTLNKEKEKVYRINKDNNSLKEKNEFLEKKLLLKDKEKLSLEKRLIEKNKENENLKQEINEKNSNNKDKTREEKFSIKKWIFDNKG